MMVPKAACRNAGRRSLRVGATPSRNNVRPLRFVAVPWGARYPFCAPILTYFRLWIP